MSKIEVNAIEPQSGTTLTLGASGDTITIPAGATISNSGTAAGFGPTGAVSWNTTKVTTGFTAVSGVGYFCDTTSTAFTVTLPSSPSAGAVVGIADYANTFATNNITVARNSSNIGGVAGNATLSTNGISITLVYVDATQGWIITDSGSRSDIPVPQFIAATGGTVTTCGNFKIHTFTGPGTFTVSSLGNPIGGPSSVDYLVVAGGGGGGFDRAGGGGAGGYRTTFPSPGCNAGSFPITVQGYPITVGAGGTGQTTYPATGTNGSNSIFSTITSNGGGYGGGGGTPVAFAASSGGSGGGGKGQSPLTGGTGNTPPVSPSQGNNGGVGVSGPFYGSGGGGGAAAVGGAGTTTVGGVGGAGSTNSITGSPVAYAGGGGGSVDQSGSARPGGAGGTGGGGAGGSGPGQAGTAGTANTGGGGGGDGNLPTNAGGAGGSGIVIIRYKFQ